MRDLTYRAANRVGRGVIRALGVDVRLHGLHHLPTTGPVLLACTHVSFLDFVMVERGAVERGRYVRFLTQRQAWVKPLVWRAMDAMQHVPVDREAPAAAYLRARRLLAAGEAVGIFPEAGISHAFTVRALMRGTAALAAESGAPVVPVALWGPQRITSVGDPTRRPDLTRGRVVDVIFGAPLLAAPGADVTAWTHALGHTLTGMLEALQTLPHHRPRPGEHAPWHPAHLGGHAPDVVRGAELDELPVRALAPSWGPAPPGEARHPAEEDRDVV
jgi:1-acyl-sn-glycerol-3-phosphate acyltransferase